MKLGAAKGISEIHVETAAGIINGRSASVVDFETGSGWTGKWDRMVQAEPRIYVTVPSLRIWARQHPGLAIALTSAAAVAIIAIVVAAGYFWILS
ncbi:hypothetical protein [[Mycobacterium] burgundiense]|uniref:Uncharacterized protein n=1 Tax=[Mycobacterium] burgundiense TaxID=3064286 RepID=A0ABM9LRL2_9MYCO|nr:hypothetical protein [Mycolicibacterium sp. MU0053]CAJ1503525.1 hypothetical protein MU0053_002457 [Mycolicibacterium sp. MU0053]